MNLDVIRMIIIDFFLENYFIKLIKNSEGKKESLWRHVIWKREKLANPFSLVPPWQQTSILADFFYETFNPDKFFFLFLSCRYAEAK